jgi:hypothetical protein
VGNIDPKLSKGMTAFEFFFFEDVDLRGFGLSIEGADKWDGAGSVETNFG